MAEREAAGIPSVISPRPSPTQELRTKIKSSPWLQTLGTFIVYVATWGFLSTYGTYQSYYETVLLRDHTTDEIAWVGTVEGVLLILCGVVAGPIYDRGHARALLVLGSLLTVGGVLALSAARAYYQVLLAQGVCVGLGSGLLYLPSISLVAASFDRPGPRTLAAGLATSGTAVGGVVYPVVLERLLPAVGFGWGTRILGLVTLAELAVALLVLLPHTRRKRHSSTTTAPPQAAAAVPPRSLFDAAALGEPAFLAFCLALFFMWAAYWVPFFLIPTFAQFALGASESWAFYLLVITNAATIPGRFLAVAVIPHLGVAGAMVFFSLSSAVLLYTWAAVTTIQGFEVWIVLIGIFMTPLAALYPTIVPQLCPKPDVLGTRMGMSSAAAALGIILGAPLSSAMTDMAMGQFWKTQVLIGSTMILGSVLMTFVWWKTRKQAPK